jgi:transcriptional regulator GlxA family with amidase domain
VPVFHPIRSVAIVAMPGVQPFELGVAWEGFGIDRTDDGVPAYDCFVVSETRSVPTAAGYSLSIDDRLDRARDADLVIVPANADRTQGSDAVLDLLRETVDRGARVMSVCSGAFALGEAGLLDDRDCTTHWKHTDELAERFPLARVNPNVLFVCDGPVLTSAGTASGLDLCLHLIRAETGTSPHLWITHQRVLFARRMLEEGDDPIDTVAERCGFGTGAMLRHHFARIVGVSPASYRRTFRRAAS